MQTTFIGPDGQEYSLDQAGPRSFEARAENGRWHITLFDQQTGEPRYEFRGSFPTAFDRDLWVDLRATARAESNVVFFAFGSQLAAI